MRGTGDQPGDPPPAAVYREAVYDDEGRFAPAHGVLGLPSWITDPRPLFDDRRALMHQFDLTVTLYPPGTAIAIDEATSLAVDLIADLVADVHPNPTRIEVDAVVDTQGHGGQMGLPAPETRPDRIVLPPRCGTRCPFWRRSGGCADEPSRRAASLSRDVQADGCGVQPGL